MAINHQTPELEPDLKPPARPPRPSTDAAAEDDDDRSCWICAGPVLKRHCKIVCPRCGFMRDCSDP